MTAAVYGGINNGLPDAIGMPLLLGFLGMGYVDCLFIGRQVLEDLAVISED